MSSRLNGEVPQVEDYLTIEELSARLKIKSKTIKNKMASGIFRKGVHYFSPLGLGPHFKWSAVVSWIEQRENIRPLAESDSIPMARGYLLGQPPAVSDNQK
jgi:hypothetical protein